MSALVGEGLHLRYGEREAVRGVDIAVQTGEVLGLIGPNGSGKTTLLRALSGAKRPDDGSVRLDGRDLYTMATAEIARSIAVVGQEIRLDFDFTVGQFAAMGRHPHLGRFSRMSDRDRDAVDRALAETDTSSLADRYVTELSGGERQRAAIAQALAQEPAILLLDEPTAHLDLNHQVEVLDLLARLNRARGLALLLVTHDLNAAGAYCERLLLLREGTRLAEGPPESVLVPQTLRESYGADTIVQRHPNTGAPVVLPAHGKQIKE